MRFFLPIRNKLILLFQLIAVIPFLFFTWIIENSYSENIKDNVFDKLTAIRESKKELITNYFETLKNDARFLSEHHLIINATSQFQEALNTPQKKITAIEITELKEYYATNSSSALNKYFLADSLRFFPKDNKTLKLQHLMFCEKLKNNANPYVKVHQSYHKNLEKLLTDHGYYDLFLIDLKGNIVYTSIKEMDFGTNLITGPYKQSSLAKTFNKIISQPIPGKIEIQDFDFHPPSLYDPAAFIGSPIYEGKKCKGVLVFQIPVDKIDKIMTSHNVHSDLSMDETGESYLVGADLKMRSNSRFIFSDRDNFLKQLRLLENDPDIIDQMSLHNSTILFQKVENKSVKNGLNGMQGVHLITDYRGTSVLSSYSFLEIEGLNWVILSEIDKNEAFKDVKKLRIWLLWVIGVSLLIILITSIYTAGFLSKPIRDLASAMRRVSLGNLGVRVDIGQFDELKLLTNTFNSMMERIEDILEELKKSNDALLSKEISLKDQKKFIEEKNQELKELLEIKNKLFSIIGHDLRSPLNTLISLLDILKKGAINQETFAKFTDELRERLNHSTGLLNNLLQWGKRQLKTFNPSLETLNLNNIIDENVQHVNAEAKIKNIELNTQIEGSMHITADKKMLNLILRNLIINAIKFSHDNSKINIKAKWIEKEKVKISIIDNGVGMSDETIKAIFTTKIKSTYGTHKEPGTGLGLILFKDFVKALGGEIWVKSKVNIGSDFSFSLPSSKSITA